MVSYKIAYTPHKGKLLGLILILAGFFADIASKAMMTSLHINKEIIPGLLKLNLVKNTGLAFSFLNSYPYAALAINIIVFIILVIIWKKMNLTYLAISIGGACGNLLERIVTGGVTDFISVSNFSVFNVGDVLIFVGIAMTILFHHGSMQQHIPPNIKNNLSIRK